MCAMNKVFYDDIRNFIANLKVPVLNTCGKLSLVAWIICLYVGCYIVYLLITCFNSY